MELRKDLKMLINSRFSWLNQAEIIQEKKFARGGTILSPDMEAGTLAFLAEGTAFLESELPDGHRRLLDYYRSGDILMRDVIPGLSEENIRISAKTGCLILFFREKPLSPLPSETFLQQQLRTTSHIYIMAQPTIRQKLMAYFRFLQNLHGGRSLISLPISLTDLADYLAVDRSAMMRELAALKSEELITTHGKLLLLT